MAKRDESHEMSEETRRLIDDLGRRLAAEPPALFHLDQQRLLLRNDQRAQHFAVGPSTDDDPAIIDEKLRDVEAEMREAEHGLPQTEGRLQYLHEMRDILRRRLSAFGRRQRPGYMSLRLVPDYLRAVLVAAADRLSGSFWLYGEDARERRRAAEAAVAGVFPNVDGDWQVVEVDFEGRARRSSRPEGLLAYEVRQAWDGWRAGRRRRLSLREDFSHGASYRGGDVAVILSGFPGRRKHSLEFLHWLRSELALPGAAALLLVISERPPRSANGFEVSECVGRGARLGRRVAALRMGRGWNRAELARRTSLDLVYLAELEGGVLERPGYGEVQVIADALGVSLEDLSDDETPRRP